MAVEDMYILSMIGLDKVGESNPEGCHHGIFLRRQSPWGEPDLCKRLPETVSLVGIVGPALPGHVTKGGTTEDDTQMSGQHIGDKILHTISIAV